MKKPPDGYDKVKNKGKGNPKVTKEQKEEMGQRIRDRRESMKLTQEKAAELLDISLTHYKNIERGRASISLNMLMIICERFDLDQTFVLTGRDIGINPIIDFYNSLPEEKREYFGRVMYYLDQLYEK